MGAERGRALSWERAVPVGIRSPRDFIRLPLGDVERASLGASGFLLFGVPNVKGNLNEVILSMRHAFNLIAKDSFWAT